jgi:hypothetical protein
MNAWRPWCLRKIHRAKFSSADDTYTHGIIVSGARFELLNKGHLKISSSCTYKRMDSLEKFRSSFALKQVRYKTALPLPLPLLK